MVMPNSPLFKMASRAIQQSTRRAFRKSALGQVLTAAEQVSKYGMRYEGRLNSTLKRYRPMTPKRMIEDALGADFHELVHSVQHYSRGSRDQKSAIDTFLKALGPAGDRIRQVVSAAKSGGVQKEIELAKTFLETHGEIPKLPPPVAKVVSGGGKKKSLADYTTEELLAELQARGEPVQKKPLRPKPTSLPFDIPEKTRSGSQRKIVDIPMAGGGGRRFPVDHPIVTGAMQPVRSSSNVHSVGYDVEAAKLYIRFLHTDPNTGRRSQAAGSLYAFTDVEPEMFLRLYKASSKGNWIWNELRIRGTVSGHRKDYQLVGITHDYVPRKATLNAEGREIFLPRRIRTHKNRWLESSKPYQVVPDVYSGVNAHLNRGQPNTGRPEAPNSGRANTGRPN